MTSTVETCQDRVVVIGSGWFFASGISHYTYLLSSALAEEYDVGALLMRRLVWKSTTASIGTGDRL